AAFSPSRIAIPDSETDLTRRQYSEGRADGDNATLTQAGRGAGRRCLTPWLGFGRPLPVETPGESAWLLFNWELSVRTPKLSGRDGPGCESGTAADLGEFRAHHGVVSALPGAACGVGCVVRAAAAAISMSWGVMVRTSFRNLLARTSIIAIM